LDALDSFPPGVPSCEGVFSFFLLLSLDTGFSRTIFESAGSPFVPRTDHGFAVMFFFPGGVLAFLF